MTPRIRWDRKTWLVVIAGAVLVLITAGTWLVIRNRGEQEVRELAANVRQLIAAEKFDEAREPLERWLKARPGSAEAYFLLAREMFSADLFEQGFLALDKAGALGYAPPQVAVQRAIVLERLGKHDEAEPILRRFLLSTKEPDADAYKSLVKCYFETFRWTDAENVIDRWINEAPHDVRPYLWRIELGRNIKADNNLMYRFYNDALAVDPNAIEPHFGLAELFLQRHQLDQAIAEYMICMRLKPDSFEASLGLGQVYLEQGDEEKAIQHLEHAAKIAPRNPTPLLIRGKIELRQNRYESAIAYFRRALELEDEAEAHYQISLALTRLGKMLEARVEQETAARLREERDFVKNLFASVMDHPKDVARQYAVARWLIDHKHGEEGVRWAQKILHEHPQHAETNRLLADFYEAKGDHGLANFYRLKLESH